MTNGNILRFRNLDMSIPDSKSLTDYADSVVSNSWKDDCYSKKDKAFGFKDIHNHFMLEKVTFLDILIHYEIVTIEITKYNNSTSSDWETVIKIPGSYTENIIKNSINPQYFSTFSHTEIVIDPYNEILPQGEKGEAIKQKIMAIAEKYKIIFSKETSYANEPHYDLNADLRENGSFFV